MKTTLILLATTLAFVGCRQEDSAIRESAGAEKKQIEQQKETQLKQLEQQEKAVKQKAEAQKEAIEAQSEARRAELEAQQEAIRARAEAEKERIEAQAEIREAAGAAQDKELHMKVHKAIFGEDLTQPQAYRDVTVSVKGGTVTLKGTVKSEAEKAELEAKAKAVEGVTAVENHLEVKAE